MKKTDEYYLNLALKQAKKAKQLRRVPIGAVIVKKSKVVAQAHNQKDDLKDATALQRCWRYGELGKRSGLI